MFDDVLHGRFEIIHFFLFCMKNSIERKSRPWLKNVSCLGSLLYTLHRRVVHVIPETNKTWLWLPVVVSNSNWIVGCASGCVYVLGIKQYIFIFRSRRYCYQSIVSLSALLTGFDEVVASVVVPDCVVAGGGAGGWLGTGPPTWTPTAGTGGNPMGNIGKGGGIWPGPRGGIPANESNLWFKWYLRPIATLNQTPQTF